MVQLTLWFTRWEMMTLERSEFRHPLLEGPMRSVRGKTCGAYRGYNAFQWSPAVQSLMILMLKYKAMSSAGGIELATLIGVEGSPASSLDYSISKLPCWLMDIFGVDRMGNSVARRIFRRTNPERKRAGPVAVAINEHFLGADSISIFVNDEPVVATERLNQCANEITNQYYTARQAVVHKTKIAA